jgi:tryptophan synthase alpha chain
VNGKQGAIARAFAAARRERRAAFVPFLMAGDPDLGTTEELVLALAESGADVVELGVPFSDPIADGPVNQQAAGRALGAGTTLATILAAVTRLRRRTPVPIVLFSYFNPILRYGVERFAEHAAASGVDGLLLVDLPPEEAAREGLAAVAAAGIDPIFLLAPTSTAERVRAVRRLGSGFVYYVSRLGVTGERTHLPAGLERAVRTVRKQLDMPVAVGFGISTPEQAAAVAKLADGVVVGSALVRLVAAGGEREALVARVRDLATQLAGAMGGTPGGGRAR